MNKYELTLILNPNLEEETCKIEFDKIQAEIARFGGAVEKVDEWGRRRLAYEIDKLSDGIYYIVNFDGEATTPKEIENRLRINESVLRYLIVRVDD